jgi:hypothetical protein
VEAFGPPASFLSGAGAGVVLAVVLWLRRATLVPRPREQPSAVT